VARRHIDAALNALRAGEDLTDRARALARKRWKRLAREQDPYKRRRKLTRYLQRRGYSFDLIRRITEELESAD
jgi:regulatory protein